MILNILKKTSYLLLASLVLSGANGWAMSDIEDKGSSFYFSSGTEKLQLRGRKWEERKGCYDFTLTQFLIKETLAPSIRGVFKNIEKKDDPIEDVLLMNHMPLEKKSAFFQENPEFLSEFFEGLPPTVENLAFYKVNFENFPSNSLFSECFQKVPSFPSFKFLSFSEASLTSLQKNILKDFAEKYGWDFVVVRESCDFPLIDMYKKKDTASH